MKLFSISAEISADSAEISAEPREATTATTIIPTDMIKGMIMQTMIANSIILEALLKRRRHFCE
jgi:hypothetical protein